MEENKKKTATEQVEITPEQERADLLAAVVDEIIKDAKKQG